jgi:NAD(P)-dependent dehydrogenase (short-subunit alcohol dehydrogenase family)
VGLMARTLAPIVRVNAVAPGYTLPNPGEEGAPFEAYGATLPLGRTARPDEIAATVAFLLGARAVTGQAIVVDGGEHLVPRARDAMYRD